MHPIKRAIALITLLAGSTVMAQTKLPEGPIRVVVPFAPGGGVDSAARLIAKQLGTNLNLSVVVENKPGANSIIGVDQAAKAAPDGYTMLMASTAFTMNPAVIVSSLNGIGVAPLIMMISAPYSRK